MIPPEQMAALVNKRRLHYGKEPVRLAHVERILRWLRGPSTHARAVAFKKRLKPHAPATRWDFPRKNTPSYRSGGWC